MVQETIRFSESMAEKVESLIEDGVFDTKSEFYRFSAETLLISLLDDHEPDMIDYEHHQESVRETIGDSDNKMVGDGGGGNSDTEQDRQDLFYSSVVTIRRLARKNDIESAEEHIDSHYSRDTPEFLILEELLDYYTSVH